VEAGNQEHLFNGQLTFWKNEWILTERAFAKLLAYLDADAEIAGEKYETAYRMLVKFSTAGSAFS